MNVLAAQRSSRKQKFPKNSEKGGVEILGRYCRFSVNETATTSAIQPQNLGAMWISLDINPPAGVSHIVVVKLVHP